MADQKKKNRILVGAGEGSDTNDHVCYLDLRSSVMIS